MTRQRFQPGRGAARAIPADNREAVAAFTALVDSSLKPRRS
jgi:hypothetical protein